MPQTWGPTAADNILQAFLPTGHKSSAEAGSVVFETICLISRSFAFWTVIQDRNDKLNLAGS